MANSSTSRQTPFTVTSPFENDTHVARSISATAWVDSPNVRGTFDILQTCLLTLLACIYTALHLNVPARTDWYITLRLRIKWILLALFAPEVVLFMAGDQLQQARNLRQELRRLQEEADSETVDKKFDFNLRYCFFVVMGGICVNISEILSFDDLDEYKRSLFQKGRGPPTVQLAPAAIIRLAKRGYWRSIYVSPHKINDKSKADYFQKSLVVIQVSWMIIQCIARKVENLPLTLLEVHTMVHVICAVLLYACWFQKPLNIEDPEVLTPTDCLGDISLMVQGQMYTEWNSKLALCPPRSKEDQGLPLIPGIWQGKRWLDPQPPCFLKPGEVTTSGLVFPWPQRRNDDRFPITAEFLRRWDNILTVPPSGDSWSITRRNTLFPSFLQAPARSTSTSNVSLEPLTAPKAPELAKLADFTEFRSISSNMIDDKELPFRIVTRNLLFEAADPEWTYRIAAMLHISVSSTYNLISSSVLTILYGGIHLVAWSWDFPSSIEATLWKISCLYICCSYIIIYLTIPRLLVKFNGENWSWREIFLLILFYLWFFIYTLARIFIILESFLGLRHVPVGVYLTPDWLQMFPHV